MNIKFDDSFNWLAVLKDLAAGMPITIEERTQLCALSMDWPTCACGQLCKAIPRDSGGVPKDARLYQFGGKFAGLVHVFDWAGAIQLFHNIEIRTSELLGLGEPPPQSAYDHAAVGKTYSEEKE